MSDKPVFITVKHRGAGYKIEQKPRPPKGRWYRIATLYKNSRSYVVLVTANSYLDDIARRDLLIQVGEMVGA